MSDSNDYEDVAGDSAGTADDGENEEAELPERVLEEAERLTRLERTATVPEERETYDEERERLLESHEFTARVRQDDDGDVLVLHPEEWHEDGVIRTERIEDISRAVEIPLEGAGEPDNWETVDAANRNLVEAVRAEHGDVHGDNAAALADFMSNHYAKPIESASGDELAEFLAEYFVRNAWPSNRQREAVERSIELVFETAEKPVPEFQ